MKEKARDRKESKNMNFYSRCSVRHFHFFLSGLGKERVCTPKVQDNEKSTAFILLMHKGMA